LVSGQRHADDVAPRRDQPSERPVLSEGAGGQTAGDECATGCRYDQIDDGICDDVCYNSECNYDGADCECARGCRYSWISDGVCDDACYNAECNYDGTDCECAPGCPYSWIGDGFCDAACYNAECNYDGTDCECAPGCPYSWIGDGICDDACYNEACNYDGGDCCAPGCPTFWVGDGICDPTCYNETCNFDGGDCDCAPGCPYIWIGDGICDPTCYNEVCNFDGGDCECAPGCPSFWIGDAICDPSCDNEACNFDGGDCNGLAPQPILSEPAACIIDARIPYRPDQPSVRRGFDSLRITFSGPTGLTEDEAADYTVEQTPAGPPDPPTIIGVTLFPTDAVLTFSEPIQPNCWTCVRHNASNKAVCLGFLPADVNSNGAALPNDIIDLIDHLNAIRIPPLALHQCDIDRSDVCLPADIISLIDLLVGVLPYSAQIGDELPPCPYTLP